MLQVDDIPIYFKVISKEINFSARNVNKYEFMENVRMINLYNES